MNKVNTITIKIDEDNDIYEMTVNNEVYTLDNVYESEYSELFDELNIIANFTILIRIQLDNIYVNKLTNKHYEQN